MKIKNIILGIMLAALIFAAGCVENITNDELKAKLIEANSNLKTYSFVLDMDMDMAMKSSLMNADLKAKLITDGKIDQDNKKMEMNMKMSYGGQGLNMDMDVKAYIDGDYMYMKMFNTWIKQSLTEGASDVWDDQNQAEQMLELVESGTIERLADESKNENDYYVLKILPSQEKLAEYLMKSQKSNNQLLADSSLDYSKMIKSYAVTVWINKNTFVAERYTIAAKMVIDSSDMEGVDADEKEQGSIEMDIKADISISDINKPISINIPQEALEAKSYTDMMGDDLGMGGSSADMDYPADDYLSGIDDEEAVVVYS